MYEKILLTHSLLRYFVMFSLLLVIIMSLMGWTGKKAFTSVHNRVGLYLLIFTHLQFLAGLVLYFVSPFVQFSGDTMKDNNLRYWSVEHVVGMVIAVALITAARTTSKRLATDEAKHKRLFIFNTIALIVILGTLASSGRGLFSMSVM